MTAKNKTLFANIAMLTAAAIWGLSFVVMKTTLDDVPPNTILALRFSVGALALSFTLFRNKLTLKKIGSGALTGAALYLAFAAQTYGLQGTTASKNAFITVVYVVLVPVFTWLIKKERPNIRVLISAVLCFLGIGLLVLTDRLTIGYGDALTFICGCLFAVHIVLVGLFEKECGVMLITFMQFFFAAVFAWGAALVTEPMPIVMPVQALPGLLYLSLGSTLLGFTLQNIGIRLSKPSVAALILSTESMFACLFGVLLLGDQMTVRMWAGALVIIVSLVLAQINIKGKAKKDSQQEESVNKAPVSLSASDKL
jgi:drug/metabolite transporter (DMT)-like permease